MPDVALQAATKVLVQSRATRQDDVLVQSPSYVDGRGLDDVVDNGRERGEEVGGVDLGVEEDLGRKETFVANVDCGCLPVGVGDGVLLEPVI